jgi:hypothetical protein
VVLVAPAQTVAARDALRAEFEEKNADLKLELMDLDLNRALHVESIVKKVRVVRVRWCVSCVMMAESAGWPGAVCR